MYLGIKEGKIFDITTNLLNKRDPNDKEVNYIVVKLDDYIVGDTWDFKNNLSLKDSPIRFEILPKNDFQLMKEAILELEYKNDEVMIQELLDRMQTDIDSLEAELLTKEARISQLEKDKINLESRIAALEAQNIEEPLP